MLQFTVNQGKLVQQIEMKDAPVMYKIKKVDENGKTMTDSKGNVMYEKVEGTVSEASFAGGEGVITIGDKTYPIGYVESIRNNNK